MTACNNTPNHTNPAWRSITSRLLLPTLTHTCPSCYSVTSDIVTFASGHSGLLPPFPKIDSVRSWPFFLFHHYPPIQSLVPGRKGWVRHPAARRGGKTNTWNFQIVVGEGFGLSSNAGVRGHFPHKGRGFTCCAAKNRGKWHPFGYSTSTCPLRFPHIYTIKTRARERTHTHQ